QDDSLGYISQAVKADYINRVDNLLKNYERAGASGSFEAGVEVGKMLTEAAALVAGGAGLAKGGVKLTERVAAKLSSKGGKSADKVDKVVAKGTSGNKPLEQAGLEAQHGKGNVAQGGGNSLQTKETVTGNIAESQKGNNTSNFGQHVAKEQEVNAGKGTSGATQ